MTEPNAPLPIKAMLRNLGAAPGGSIRAKLARGIDAALFSFWEGACVLYDGETAAVMTFALCTFDPTFDIPLWLQLRLRKHRGVVIDAVDSGQVKQVSHALEEYFRCR